MRAAAALAHHGQVKLHTAVESSSEITVRATAGAHGFQMEIVDRDLPIVFSYLTPLSVPVIDGTNQPIRRIDVSEDEPTIVFGMLEIEANVNAPVIVYDPQRPRGPKRSDLDSLVADRLAIVANSSEIRALGNSPDLGTAAQYLIDHYRVEVVVVKRGPLGATVYASGQDAQHVGPYRTSTVWPVGSGDVFTSIFGHHWAVAGRTAWEAAQEASLATATYCVTNAPNSRLLREFDGVKLAPRQEEVLVYLAGPFFSLHERWLVDTALDALRQQGGDVFSPLHEVGIGGDEVALYDIEGLKQSEVVLGLLDGSDAGTLFELGYACCGGKQVIGYASNPESDDYKMLRGLGVPVFADFATAIYHSIWAAMKAA